MLNPFNSLKQFQLAKNTVASSRKIIFRLKKLKPKNLDTIAGNAHHEAFQNIDCLECANCCKSISPMITDKDIARISKYLKMRPSVFTEKYLHLDHDHDYVFNQTPCPFLGIDNYCSIYDARPKACAEFPHTDRRNFIQILDLTLKNTFICPAAYEVMETLKNQYK